MTDGAAEKSGNQPRDGSGRLLPKRFYKHVEVSAANDILLDGRTVRTPLKMELVLPTAGLASAIAAEWDAQKDFINPHAMPLTRLANTALDRGSAHAEAIKAEIMGFAACDLVCYRAESPPGLVARQSAAWDPVIAWSSQMTGPGWQVTTGVRHVEQPKALLASLAQHLPKDAFRLVGCHALTTLSGSALLALMLTEGAIEAEQAWAAACIDEQWQAEQWGHDAEAAARSASRAIEFAAAASFVNLASAVAAGVAPLP